MTNTRSKKLLSLLLALVMVIGLLPMTALAADAEAVPQEDTTITVDVTAQSGGAFLDKPQMGVDVSDSLAESYGYTDKVTDGVSALDVLVRAHELRYLDAFNSTTKDNYLAVDGDGTVTKAFGNDVTNPFGFVVNGEVPTGAVNEAAIADGALVEFYVCQTEIGVDSYLLFSTSATNSNRVAALSRTANHDVSLYIYGYIPGSSGDGAGLNRMPMQGMQPCLIDSDSGAVKDIGTVSDGNGMVTVRFPAAGEYYLSAYDPNVSEVSASIMPLVKVTAYAAPIVKDIKLYEDDEAFEAGQELDVWDAPFDGTKLEGNSITVPDYLYYVYVATSFDGVDDGAYAGRSTVTIDGNKHSILYYKGSGMSAW